MLSQYYACALIACPVLQSDEDGSTNRGLRTDAAEEPQTFAQSKP